MSRHSGCSAARAARWAEPLRHRPTRQAGRTACLCPPPLLLHALPCLDAAPPLRVCLIFNNPQVSIGCLTAGEPFSSRAAPPPAGVGPACRGQGAAAARPGFHPAVLPEAVGHAPGRGGRLLAALPRRPGAAVPGTAWGQPYWGQCVCVWWCVCVWVGGLGVGGTTGRAGAVRDLRMVPARAARARHVSGLRAEPAQSLSLTRGQPLCCAGGQAGPCCVPVPPVLPALAAEPAGTGMHWGGGWGAWVGVEGCPCPAAVRRHTLPPPPPTPAAAAVHPAVPRPAGRSVQDGGRGALPPLVHR